MRRSYFLKYVSFVMMPVSLVRFFFGLSMFNVFATARNVGTADQAAVRLAAVNLGLLTACALAELVCGFRGALNWEEPLRAGKVVRLGAVTLLLGLAGNLMQAFTGYGVSYVAWITGAAAPALYLLAGLHFYRGAKKGDKRREKP